MFFAIMDFLKISFLIMDLSLHLSFGKKLVELLSVKVKLSSTFHPQIDGQTEWVN
jgi:hypothetical protein